jgi:hypothetical protein
MASQKRNAYVLVLTQDEYSENYMVEDDLVGIYGTLERAKTAARDRFERDDTRVEFSEGTNTNVLVVSSSTPYTRRVDGVTKIVYEDREVAVIITKVMNRTSLCH